MIKPTYFLKNTPYNISKFRTSKKSKTYSIYIYFFSFLVAHTLIFDYRPFIRFRHSFRMFIYLRILSRSPEMYSRYQSKWSNSFSTQRLLTRIFSHEFLQWLTKNVTIVLGTESLMFFLTTLKQDVINLFIISVQVCSLSFAFYPTFMTVGTQGKR